MMKSHGIASNAASIKPSSSRGSGSTKNQRRDSGGSSSTKKRKAEAFLDDTNTADDDEGYGGHHIKSESASLEKEQFVVKEEEQQTGQLSLDEATNLIQYYNTPDSYGIGTGDGGYHGFEGSSGETDCGAPGSGYVTSMGGSYGMHTSQAYDLSKFSMSYGSLGLTDIPRSENHGLSYQPVPPYSANGHGRSDSPVILE
jgi:hypothetical protein